MKKKYFFGILVILDKKTPAFRQGRLGEAELNHNLSYFLIYGNLLLLSRKITTNREAKPAQEPDTPASEEDVKVFIVLWRKTATSRLIPLLKSWITLVIS
jgi:hypothetical protein